MSFVAKQGKNGSLVVLVIVLVMLVQAAAPSAHGLTIGVGRAAAPKPPVSGTRSGDGLAWSQVGESGFGDANNVEVKSMAVFNGYLYAGIKNSSAGTGIWRTADGVSWDQANADGFGDANNMNSTLVPFGDYLYAATDNRTLGGGTGCEIWRTDDGTEWNQVGTDGFGDANNIASFTVAVFNDTLYVGTMNYASGGELWRSPDGTTWEQANTDGFGDTNNLRAMAMSVFDGYLYVGTKNGATGAEIWRTDDGTSWEQANNDGFGSAANDGVYALASFGGYLYAGSMNASTGGQLWRTPDGTTWELVIADGFGDQDNDAIMLLSAFEDEFYAGTARAVSATTGAELWRSSNGTSWSQANADGFGEATNEQINCLTRFGRYYYAGVRNETIGGQVWRTARTSIYLPLVAENLGASEPVFPWAGQVINEFFNCGLTRVFGFTLDRNGGLKGDVWVRYWADGWTGAWAKSQWTQFGTGTPWLGDEGNWDGVIDDKPRAGVWHVCVATGQGSQDCLSNTVDVTTSADCENGFQVYRIRFQEK